MWIIRLYDFVAFYPYDSVGLYNSGLEPKLLLLLHCALSCAVYCNRPCLCFCLWVRLTTASAVFASPLSAFFIMPPLGDIKRCFCLTSVCLAVTYIWNNSRTKRPRKTKIGTQVAHVTRNSDTTFKVKRSKVNLQGRGNIVADSRTSLIFINSLIFMAPTGTLEARRAGRRRRKWWDAAGPLPQWPAYSGRGHIVSPHAQLVTITIKRNGVNY